MDRRRYLALAAGVGTAIVAGCTSDDDSPETTTDGDEAAAADHIETAGRRLDEAGQLMEDESGSDDSGFQVEEIRGKLSDAESALDEAETDATEDQQQTIADARAVIAWARTFVDVMESAKTGLDATETANSYFQTDRYDDARSELDEAESAFETAEDDLGVARSDFENIDPSSLDAFESASATTAMDDMAALLDAMIGFTEGFRHLTDGFEQYTTAAGAFEDERWGDAIDPFVSARGDFSAAESTFRETEEDAPQETVQSMIQLTCLADAMTDATTHFENAARAAQNRNWSRFDTESQEATSAMERCDT